MELILGMDIGVFIAWIGTLLAAVLCVVYGVYFQFIKKSTEPQQPAQFKEKEEKQKEEQ